MAFAIARRSIRLPRPPATSSPRLIFSRRALAASRSFGGFRHLRRNLGNLRLGRGDMRLVAFDHSTRSCRASCPRTVHVILGVFRLGSPVARPASPSECGHAALHMILPCSSGPTRLPKARQAAGKLSPEGEALADRHVGVHRAERAKVLGVHLVGIPLGLDEARVRACALLSEANEHVVVITQRDYLRKVFIAATEHWQASQAIFPYSLQQLALNVVASIAIHTAMRQGQRSKTAQILAGLGGKVLPISAWYRTAPRSLAHILSQKSSFGRQTALAKAVSYGTRRLSCFDNSGLTLRSHSVSLSEELLGRRCNLRSLTKSWRPARGASTTAVFTAAFRTLCASRLRRLASSRLSTRRPRLRRSSPSMPARRRRPNERDSRISSCRWCAPTPQRRRLATVTTAPSRVFNGGDRGRVARPRALRRPVPYRQRARRSRAA